MFLGVGIDARVPCIRNESETETDDKVAMPYLQSISRALVVWKVVDSTI